MWVMREINCHVVDGGERRFYVGKKFKCERLDTTDSNLFNIN